MNKTSLNKSYYKFLVWRRNHITERNFVIILSLAIGVLTGFAAYLMKFFIHQIQYAVVNLAKDSVNYWYFLFPLVGIFLAAIFVKFLIKDDISHGITKILRAISQHKAIIKFHNTYSSIVASSLTMGFGGSVGPEAPIIMTGSAIGSNVGKVFKLDQRTLMLLVGCGAAGALAGIFKAPIAGVAFVLEVLLLDLTMANIAPLLISAISATAVSFFLTGNHAFFYIKDLEPFSVGRIPFLILLGIICGFMSLYFVRSTSKLEMLFKKINHFWIKILVGGISLGLLIFLFPPLYGEGYDTISSLLNGKISDIFSQSFFKNLENNPWILIVFVGCIMFVKSIASALTMSSGGIGGLFAPSLFVGCLTGFLVAYILKMMGFNIPLINFAFAGMAGLMSGVMHAPLTGIFLIAELTGGYSLFMSLMIVSVISYITIIIFEPYSVYARHLAQKGELLTHNKDKGALILLKMEDVIETDLEEIFPEMLLGDLVKLISHSHRNAYPVVDKSSKKLLGIVELNEIRDIMFRSELYDKFTVKKLMREPSATISHNSSMEKVMEVFEQTGAWILPVTDDKGIYLGFISKSKIFNSYRKILVQFSED
jgi:CIC family chloride channel protein